MAHVGGDQGGDASGGTAEGSDLLPDGPAGGLVLLALAITAAFGVLGAAGIEVVAYLLG
jgi:hypothetical protein